MTRIFIEDEELDITKDFSQQITYAVDDLTNTDSKSTSFSKTIVLPGTSNNNRLFGNIFEFGNSNFGTPSSQSVGYGFNASKSAKARLEINGLQVMKGVLRLLEIIRDGEYIEYEVALFGELGGFFSSLGARKIEQLDFSAYNHVYNVTNITNSWDNVTGGTGYYYPLIDYGNVSPANNAQFAKKNFYFTAFRPALFLREYIDKIIKNAGYTWSSTFFDTNFFKRLIVPNNQIRLSYISTRIFAATPQMAATLNSTTLVQGLNLLNPTQSNFTTTDNKVWTYTGLQSFTGKITINLNGTWGFIFPNNTQLLTRIVNFKVLINDVEIDEGSRTPFMQIGGTSLPNRSNSFQINHVSPFNGEITLNTNDTFQIVVSGGTTNVTMGINVNSGSIQLNGNPIYTPANYGDSLVINDTIPKGILQKDFFTSVLKMFNLMVTEDKDVEKRLVIEPYVDFYNTDRTTYLDWSDKLDRNKPIKIKPMSEINARFYEFKYKIDNDHLNEQYRKKYVESFGDSIFDNNLEFTKDTDKTEVIFSATQLIGYAGLDKVFPAIYKLNNNAEEMIEHNIRILQAKKITGRTSWFIKSMTATNLSSSLTSYGYAGHLDDWTNPTSDLNFGAPKELKFNVGSTYPSANLFNAYYSPYFAEITDKDSRLVTCKMRLNEKDIFNLDFGRFVWVDGILYRLIKIVDYTEDDVCEVQLLRAINTTY